MTVKFAGLYATVLFARINVEKLPGLFISNSVVNFRWKDPTTQPFLGTIPYEIVARQLFLVNTRFVRLFVPPHSSKQ